MLSRRSHRTTAALVAGCCVAGGIATALSGGASAQTPAPHDATGAIQEAVPQRTAVEGKASMSSPYIPGVPHVPANVALAVGSGGEARYIGPEGSIFNGPAAKVDARIDAWWAEEMAAGVTPEEADAKLASGEVDVPAGPGSSRGLASMRSPYIPGVWHVPSHVLLSVSPEGDARYLGPDGSIFDGPADEVGARVDAWWADQMAAGVTPEEADEKLAELSR